MLAYVARFPPASHEDLEDGNRIATINAVEGPERLISVQDIMYLIGILTDPHPPTVQGESAAGYRRRRANRFIISRNFGGISSPWQMRDRHL